MGLRALYLDWPCFKGKDLIDSLERDFGHQIIRFFHTDYHERQSESFLEAFEEKISREKADYCISYNFFPLLAEAAHRSNLKYISLVYDCPQVKLYSYRITYPTNYVFLFDSILYNKLKRGGIDTVYYSILPVNAERIRDLKQSESADERLKADVSFVGSLYNEDHNMFDRMYEKLDLYTKGYLDSIMQAQLKISGYNFIEEMLTPALVECLYKAEQYKKNADGVETLENIYADYYINRKLTSIERIQLLTAVAERFPLRLYTLDPKAVISGACNMGAVDYYTEMPHVFHDSKINLNITLRSIQSGIPLRCMDIMGCGGFLLTNYQADFLRHFEPEKDFVYYEDEKDLLKKIDYYLTHEDERQAIAANGYEKVKREYSFSNVLAHIFTVVGIV